MIVANTTFRIAPWADALFAMDRQWWEKYHAEASRDFRGLKFSSNNIPANWGVKWLIPEKFNAYANSGAGCVSMAVHMGAKKVVMLGFDCQKTEGKAHWHGDHPAGLGNAGAINRWPAKFEMLRRDVGGKATILNASRTTALTMFERVDLEDALTG